MHESKLQLKEDAYLDDLNSALDDVDADGDWDWPNYNLNNVSAVVLGWRRLGNGQIEGVYSVTVQTTHAVPHAGEGKQDLNDDGSRFTFVQPANSVPVGAGFETQLLSTCVWTPTPKKKKKGLLKAQLVAQDADPDPPAKPHPP